MKKTILILAATALIASLSSCKKEYTCKCEKTYTTGTGTNTEDHSRYTFDDTRARAESRCNEHSTSGQDLFGDYSINCKIQ